MVTTVTKEIYDNARAKFDSKDIAGGWKVLGDAGDEYAAGAAKIIGQHNDAHPEYVWALVATLINGSLHSGDYTSGDWADLLVNAEGANNVFKNIMDISKFSAKFLNNFANDNHLITKKV